MLVKRDVDDGEYEDSAMKVEYIPIFPSSDLMLTEQPQGYFDDCLNCSVN